MIAKFLSGIFLMVRLAASAHVIDQQPPGVVLQPLHPQKGSSVTVNYIPEGKLAAADHLQATLFYISDYHPESLFDQSIASELQLTGSKRAGWKTTFTLPDSAIAFGVRFKATGVQEENNLKGYLFPVYQGKQPVTGGYAGIGRICTYTDMGLKPETYDTILRVFEKEFALHPLTKNQFLYPYYYYMNNVKGREFSLPGISRAVDSMLAHEHLSEEEYITAVKLSGLVMHTIGDTRDSVLERGYRHFPSGKFAINYYMRDKVANLSKRDDLDSFLVFHQDFLRRFPATDAESDAGQVDILLNALISTKYANDGNYAKAIEYSERNQKYTNMYLRMRCDMYIGIASIMAEKKEQTELGESYAAKGIQYLEEWLDKEFEKTFVPSSFTLSDMRDHYRYRVYPFYADVYAQLLALNGKYAQALDLQRTVFERTKGENADFNEHYIEYLSKTGNTKEVMAVLSRIIPKGEATVKMKTLFKAAYIQEEGSDRGVNERLASLEKKAKGDIREKMLQAVKKAEVNIPAKDFSLSDMEGNTVALSSLKGKIIVLDFWAVWCAPCKAAMPSMKLAIEKYKSDTNVVFLFVNTFHPENRSTRINNINRFIQTNGYPFRVLLDMEKGAGTNKFVMAGDYQVASIPTKIIIDPKGVIRFKNSGFAGENEVLEEISMMIEQAKE